MGTERHPQPETRGADPAIQEQLPFEPVLVSVPAGPFLMGTTGEQMRLMEERFDWFRDGKVTANPKDPWRRCPTGLSDLQPASVITLPAFQISRFLVTDAQMDVYYWETRRWAPWRWYEAGSPPEMANHPASEVPWKEAQAYAGWLHEQTGRRAQEANPLSFPLLGFRLVLGPEAFAT